MLEAQGEAANLFFSDDKGEKAIEHAYRQYKDVLQGHSDQWLTEVLPPQAAEAMRSRAPVIKPR